MAFERFFNDFDDAIDLLDLRGVIKVLLVHFLFIIPNGND